MWLCNDAQLLVIAEMKINKIKIIAPDYHQKLHNYHHMGFLVCDMTDGQQKPSNNEIDMNQYTLTISYCVEDKPQILRFTLDIGLIEV